MMKRWLLKKLVVVDGFPQARVIAETCDLDAAKRIALTVPCVFIEESGDPYDNE